jgi:hypothetical protein
MLGATILLLGSMWLLGAVLAWAVCRMAAIADRPAPTAAGPPPESGPGGAARLAPP